MTHEVGEVDTVAIASRAALEAAGGEVQKAASVLTERVRKDRSLKAAILEPLVEYACYQAVQRASRDSRGRVWPMPSIKPGLTDEQRVAALAADNLLMFPLPGGKALGEATRGDIAAASDFYGKQAADMSHKARWLALVAQSLPDGKIAKQVLSTARLRELQQEAANA